MCVQEATGNHPKQNSVYLVAVTPLGQPVTPVTRRQVSVSADQALEEEHALSAQTTHMEPLCLGAALVSVM
ncbi:hypothetical protein CRENBAI_001198 [Crenichthys baileyi]|uniref:Uncharacterized protein n=1 Tax=Crenichthys baileyi TaxID=28760 RepID=A0AAV9QYL0_9TELE